MIDANKQWMATGKIGCTFAALFAKNPSKVNWVTIVNPETFYIPDNAAILSFQFPNGDISSVRTWALKNGFYEEIISDNLTGLRYKIGSNIAWVQYFGFDSHVVTRQAPVPELMLCVKLPLVQFAKVGFNGILHLAHTCVASLTERKANKLWETSYKNTAKKLGHSPSLIEAAKTTYQL